jgi:hypothetical protein
MYAQIYGSLVFKTASAFCLSFDRGRVKRFIPLSNVSASNVPLCHGQHVAHELQVQSILQNGISHTQGTDYIFIKVLTECVSAAFA